MKKLIILLKIILIISGTIIFAQNKVPRLSPKSFVGQTVGSTILKITYGSPGVKGRKIWGELVPYNIVWRTGANEATTIEFDSDVIIDGKKIPTGKYSLFTIPNKDTWTIILNKTYDQWGAYNYNEKEDFIRFKAQPIVNHHVERLSYKIEYLDSYKSKIYMEWEKLAVSFEIKTDLKN